jgi:hypothetical protein
MAAEDCSKVAIEAGLKSESLLKDQETSLWFVLHNGGIEVTDYRCYPMPHNGCRPPKDVEFNNIFSITR